MNQLIEMFPKNRILECFDTFSPFQIANCAFFASCLCDLLYRFEEFCSIHEKNFTSKFEQLQKAINTFHDIVVRRLNEVLLVLIDVMVLNAAIHLFSMITK